MRKVKLDKIQPGSVLGKTILTLEGKVLLTSGRKITEEFKQKLLANGITEVYIEDEFSNGIIVPEVVHIEIITEAKSMVKNIMTRPSIRTSIDGQKIQEIVDKIISNLLANENILVNLTDIRSVDDYTFSHSVNVCILSLIIGIGLGFKGDKLKELGMGSILHDIGKVKVPQELLKKPEQLTTEEFEEIKKHTYYGYEILKNVNGMSDVASFIALGHHERLDGSGYPYNLKQENIHRCARIVAVCDVYDALTSDRVYRQKMMPHEVIEYISALGTQHFDQDIVDVFIRQIAHYPVGTGIILNSGEKGLVSKYNRKAPTRPVIRVVMSSDGKLLAKQQEVDLSQKREYRIIDVWDL